MTTPIGPDFIALQVRDLAASSKFYVEIFGFETSAHCPPGAVIFKTSRFPWRYESLCVRFPPPGRSVWEWRSGLRAPTPMCCTTSLSNGEAKFSALSPTGLSVASSSLLIRTATRLPFIRRGAERNRSKWVSRR